MKGSMKKLVSMGLVLAILGGAAACKGGSKDAATDGAVKEFSIFAQISALSADNSEKTLIKKMNENMGVNINWNCVAGDAMTERKNLALNSQKDLPDAFMGAELSDYELITYGSKGLLIPLQDYINEETMPNLMSVLEQRPDTLASCTMPDGNIYGLPGISEMGFTYKDGNEYYIGAIPQFTAINQEWLDNLGLEMPNTIDELHDVLVKFKEEDANGNGDPNDEIPLSFMFENWCAGMSTLYSAFGFTDYNDQHRAYRDGEAYYNAITDNYKEAINYFHDWFEEGLIDIEVFSQDSSQYIAKGIQEQLGVFAWWEIPEVVGKDLADQYTYLPILTDAEGNSTVNLNEMGTTGHDTFSITSACNNPELLLKWVDQLYDPLYSMQKIYGPIGEFFAEKPDGDGVYNTIELKNGETEGELKGKLELMGPSRQLADDFGTYYYMEDRAQARLDDLNDFWFQYIDNFDYYPTVTFTLEETNILEEHLSDLQVYVSEKTALWLKNGGIEDEWDDYLKQMDAIGVQEVVKCWQDAADRYNEALKK